MRRTFQENGWSAWVFLFPSHLCRADVRMCGCVDFGRRVCQSVRESGSQSSSLLLLHAWKKGMRADLRSDAPPDSGLLCARIGFSCECHGGLTPLCCACISHLNAWRFPNVNNNNANNPFFKFYFIPAHKKRTADFFSINPFLLMLE